MPAPPPFDAPRSALPWPPSYVHTQDVELAFERARLAEWVADIKALIAKDLEGLPGWGAGQRCFLPG